MQYLLTFHVSLLDIFSVLSGCLPYARSKLHKLQMSFAPGHTDSEGVSAQALYLPSGVLQYFDELRELHLLIQTKDDMFRSELLRVRTVLAMSWLTQTQIHRPGTLGRVDSWHPALNCIIWTLHFATTGRTL